MRGSSGWATGAKMHGDYFNSYANGILSSKQRIWRWRCTTTSCGKRAGQGSIAHRGASAMGWAPPDPRTCGSEENSFELLDEEELPPIKRQVQPESQHRAMAPPPGGDGDDPGRDRRDRRDRRRDRGAPERDHGPEPPQEDDEDEDEDDHPRSVCTTQGSARPPGYWHRGRGQGTKIDMETGEEVGTVLHGTRGPNMNWQQIYGKGLRPRQLFSGNQGGKRSAQSTPTLTGAGNTPEEQMRSVYVTTGHSKGHSGLASGGGGEHPGHASGPSGAARTNCSHRSGQRSCSPSPSSSWSCPSSSWEE